MSKEIRLLEASAVADAVRSLFIQANHRLPADVQACMTCASRKETNPLASRVLERLCENARVAEQLDVPMCQDTGMAVVFADVGEHVHITGGTLEEAVNLGVARAYTLASMRLSVVQDPLYDRRNTENNTPAIVHIRTVKGDKLHLTAAPKGFGSENMSALKMMTPAATEADIVDFVVEHIKRAGSNPCPPIVVGVGIGADFEGVALLAKRALLRPLDDKHADERYAALEEALLRRINQLGIGPQGFGGDTTALAVKVEFAPTHIAGLPVAVNVNCHVCRHAQAVL